MKKWSKKGVLTVIKKKLTANSYKNRQKLLCQCHETFTATKQTVTAMSDMLDIPIVPYMRYCLFLERDHCAISRVQRPGSCVWWLHILLPPYPTKYIMLRLPAYCSRTNTRRGVMMTPVCLVKSVLIWTNCTYFVFKLHLVCISWLETRWCKNTSRPWGFTSTLSRLLWR